MEDYKDFSPAMQILIGDLMRGRGLIPLTAAQCEEVEDRANGYWDMVRANSGRGFRGPRQPASASEESSQGQSAGHRVAENVSATVSNSGTTAGTPDVPFTFRLGRHCCERCHGKKRYTRWVCSEDPGRRWYSWNDIPKCPHCEATIQEESDSATSSSATQHASHGPVQYAGEKPADIPALQKVVDARLTANAHTGATDSPAIQHCCEKCHGRAREIRRACGRKRNPKSECQRCEAESLGDNISVAQRRPAAAASPSVTESMSHGKAGAVRMPRRRHHDPAPSSPSTASKTRSERAEERNIKRIDTLLEPCDVPPNLRDHNLPGLKEGPIPGVRRASDAASAVSDEGTDDGDDEPYARSIARAAERKRKAPTDSDNVPADSKPGNHQNKKKKRSSSWTTQTFSKAPMTVDEKSDDEVEGMPRRQTTRTSPAATAGPPSEPSKRRTRMMAEIAPHNAPGLNEAPKSPKRKRPSGMLDAYQIPDNEDDDDFDAVDDRHENDTADGDGDGTDEDGETTDDDCEYDSE